MHYYKVSDTEEELERMIIKGAVSIMTVPRKVSRMQK
jgi:hypothetical protein